MSSEPRKRTRVACDTCRKKKIRCDGKPRCLNCVLAKEKVCHYEERPPKKTRTGRSGRRANGHNIEFLNSRILRLEDVILSLSEKIVGGTSDDMKRSKNPSTDYLMDGESPSNTEDELNSSDDSSFDSDPGETFEANGKPRKPTTINIRQMELYFRTHSFLSIFSDRSLEWIKNQLSPENQELMTPLRNMPAIFQSKAKLFLSKWVDPLPLDHEAKNKLLTRPFPSDSAAVMSLLESQYKKMLLFNDIVEYEDVKSLFERYYASRYPSKRIFRTSQLLKMTLALLACFVGKSDYSSSSSSTPTSINSSISSTETFCGESVVHWQEELLTNAVRYYFRVCIIGEGYETVEALLLFAIYLERNCIIPEIGSMILTLAVRFAQDLGLHRIETYESLTPEVSVKRCRSWSMCCFMDMDLCFRSGRSPVINYNDVSPELQIAELSNYLKTENQKFQFFHTFFYGMFRIRMESYNRLFSATASLDSFDNLRENLDFLNSEMISVSRQIPEGQRPVFYSDPGFRPFDDFPTEEDQVRLTALLSYFMHMMVMNRLPLMFNFPRASEQVLAVYRDLSLNSARTILHLVRNINRHTLNESFGTWAMFFPMSAFLHLLAACMNQPNSPEAMADLKLMIDISVNFIGRRSISKQINYFPELEVSTLLQVLFKALLKITITIYEMKTGMPILLGNEKLRKHLDLPSKTFPELYGKPEELNVTGTLVEPGLNKRKPFASNGGQSPMASSASPTSSIMRECATKNTLTSAPSGQAYNDYDIYSNPGMNPEPFTEELYHDGITHSYDDVDSIVNSQMSLFQNIFYDNNIQF